MPSVIPGLGAKLVLEDELTHEMKVYTENSFGQGKFIDYEDYLVRDRVSKLAAMIEHYSQEELFIAFQLNRSIKEFDEDALSHLERMNNQVMFINEHKRKYGLA